jgi:hypothetical protein
MLVQMQVDQFKFQAIYVQSIMHLQTVWVLVANARKFRSQPARDAAVAWACSAPDSGSSAGQ